MPSHFTLRMQFGLHQDPAEITGWLLDLARRAPVDEVMLFFFAEELNDGHDDLATIGQWIEHSRPFRTALRDAGLAVSLNPWHSVLHLDRGRRLKRHQRWHTMVSPTGQAARAVVCPLDPDWQAYYDETLRLYAAEDFRVIWVDDDIRYHNHDPLEWGGCFCPLHVAEFNRRAGVRASRQRIVAACTAPGEPHPWRGLWMDMWEDLHLAMVARWRQIVEAGGSRLGLMSSLPECHAAEGRRWGGWWQALAGDRPPIHRPHFWGYSETVGRDLYRSIAVLDQGRSTQPAGTESGPEIECFPYGAWNKPFRQVGAQMALAHVLGSTNLNISLYDFMGNDPADEPARADFLARWRPVCDWLADEFPMSMQATGVGLPWTPEMGRRAHTDGSGRWQSLHVPSRGWATWLGGCGLAFTTRPQPVNALAGPLAWCFNEVELRQWLAGGLLLDGEAAAILVERGLGDLVGLRAGRWVEHGSPLWSVEHCLDPDFALRAGADLSVNDLGYARRLYQADLLPGARLASDLRGPRQHVVGRGLTLFENALGGRVAVVPWSAEAGVFLNAQRVAQLTKTVGWLDRTGSVGRAAGAPWLAAQFLADNNRRRGVVWNAGADEVSECIVHPPAGWRFTAATQATTGGEMLPARLERERLILPRPLGQWELAVLL